MNHALSLQNINKTFITESKEPFQAVKSVDLLIPEGQIYGLLGPNGAGKSTLINMISGVLQPDKKSGRIQIFGKDVVSEPNQAKALLGVVPQEIVVEAAFTVREVLYYFCGMYGVPASERNARILNVLTDLGLEDKIDERARRLSGGMKRRLMIAKAILHRPKLLILDEPTAGVDVALRQKIWSLVQRLNAEGTTIIFTTHYLEEAEQLCESMTVMNHGKVIKEGKVREIQEEFSQHMITFELFETPEAHLSGVKQVGVEFEFSYTDLAKDMQAILGHYGPYLKSIRNESASLEKVFLELTKDKV